MAKREIKEIKFEVLEILTHYKWLKKTHLVRKANLNEGLIKKYLVDLFNSGYIIEEKVNQRLVKISITEKGLQYYFNLIKG